jgi:hypothetical protein
MDKPRWNPHSKRPDLKCKRRRRLGGGAAALRDLGGTGGDLVEEVIDGGSYLGLGPEAGVGGDFLADPGRGDRP